MTTDAKIREAVKAHRPTTKVQQLKELVVEMKMRIRVYSNKVEKKQMTIQQAAYKIKCFVDLHSELKNEIETNKQTTLFQSFNNSENL